MARRRGAAENRKIAAVTGDRVRGKTREQRGGTSRRIGHTVRARRQRRRRRPEFARGDFCVSAVRVTRNASTRSRRCSFNGSTVFAVTVTYTCRVPQAAARLFGDARMRRRYTGTALARHLEGPGRNFLIYITIVFHTNRCSYIPSW